MPIQNTKYLHNNLELMMFILKKPSQTEEIWQTSRQRSKQADKFLQKGYDSKNFLMTTFANSVDESSESAASNASIADNAAIDDSLDLQNSQTTTKNDDSEELLN